MWFSTVFTKYQVGNTPFWDYRRATENKQNECIFVAFLKRLIFLQQKQDNVADSVIDMVTIDSCRDWICKQFRHFQVCF